MTFVLRAIFRYYGSLVGILPTEAVSAVTTVRFDLIPPDDGETPTDRLIPGGTVLAWTATDGTTVAFETVEDVLVRLV